MFDVDGDSGRAEGGNGFVFDGTDETSLDGALDRALEYYGQKERGWISVFSLYTGFFIFVFGVNMVSDSCAPTPEGLVVESVVAGDEGAVHMGQGGQVIHRPLRSNQQMIKRIHVFFPWRTVREGHIGF